MLQEVLSKKRASILKKWLNLIADTHYAGAGFLKNTDRFTNPAGHIYSSESEILFDELLSGMPDTQKISDSLQNIIKVKAVQECAASEAVSFVFLLKKALRDTVGKDIKGKPDLQRELTELESQIDEMALLAFEEYTICREKLHLIRAAELRRDRDNALKLLERSMFKYAEEQDTMLSGYTTNEVTE